MYLRSAYLASLAALLVAPTTAQFGVPGGKRAAGTNFQDLQEMAKKRAGGGGGEDADAGSMADMWKDALNNPDYLKAMGEMGDQFGDALEQMMKMSPDELAEQMEQAMKLMSDGDVVENIVNQKDEVIKSLEAAGTVSAEELARYKSDPAYFELKMRETFDQMGEIFSDPEISSKAAEMIQGMSEMMSDPKGMQEMMEALGSDWQDDGKIEEARLQMLSGDFGGMPVFKEAFDNPDMQKILRDPVKWKETVQEGFAGMMGAGEAAGVDGAKYEL